MTRVAIIIPTMNRPDFILRQFRFYELMESPHPLYIQDSSNEENAKKIKDSIQQFKNLNITYQWAPPGKDCLYQLLPLVKEKYCVQMGDDDFMIPKTISECADFLKDNPDYATCMGKQINIRFRREDNTKPYGIIEHQTLPLGRSLEDDDMLIRIKEFWFDLVFVNSVASINNVAFVCFVVRSVEIEKSIRNITKHFSLMDHVMEFLLASILVISGKFKVLDQLGYIMQISNNRYSFTHNLTVDVVTAPNMSGQWEIAHKGFAEILREKGKTIEESLKISKWIFILYLARQFVLETDSLPVSLHKNIKIEKKRNFLKEMKYLMLSNYFIKNIYYKFKSPRDALRSESKYFNDFKVVKDFLESH